MSNEMVIGSEKCCPGEINVPISKCVTSTKTLTECTNVPATPVLTSGPIIVKVPVVLAERTVEINVESTIKLEQPAIEIKRIRKNLFLTQCKLLPRVGKVFLKGFVRKNIEFATAKSGTEGCLSGDIRHTTVNVPFECVTLVPFLDGVRPIITPNTPTTKVEFFDQCNLGKDFSQQDLESVEQFNEKIFCELVEATFNEVDIDTDVCPFSKESPHEASFQNITEKLVILVTFKLLQMQQVRVTGIPMGSVDP